MLLWKAPSLSGANVESEIKGGLKNMYCTTRSILIAMDALSLGRHGVLVMKTSRRGHLHDEQALENNQRSSHWGACC